MAADHQHRERLTKGQKLQVIAKHVANRKLTYKELGAWARIELKLHKTPAMSTIALIMKSAETLAATTADDLVRKRASTRSTRALDEAVIEFIALCELENIALSGEMIMIQAKALAELLHIPAKEQPRFGWAWLRHFEARHGIKWRRAYGEVGSVDMATIEEEIERLRKIINTYGLRDVFDMDESAFFYNAAPRGSICINSAPALKQAKDRITLALCTNAVGNDKCSALFIGKSVTPRWLGDKPDHIQYRSSKKAWMTTVVYQAWLQAFDDRMRAEGRNVLLLVDNASSHKTDGMKLTNIRVEFLPPNTTSKIQPMDQGIIYCVKRCAPCKNAQCTR